MNKNQEKSLLEMDLKCAEDTMQILRGKWKALILLSLFASNKRFSEIMRDIPKITTRMLSKELKEMEHSKLISRMAYEDVPGFVEYHLTPYGHSLKPLLVEMIRWSKTF